jgi:hypothetical protein
MVTLNHSFLLCPLGLRSSINFYYVLVVVHNSKLIVIVLFNPTSSGPFDNNTSTLLVLTLMNC